MTIDEMIKKIKKLEGIKARIKERKNSLSDLRYPLGKQILKISYEGIAGSDETKLEFTSDEVKKILENSIKELETEKETFLKELNGQVIEVQEEEK